MISDKKPVQDFIQLLAQHGIQEVIICPGSRNAPFSISLSSDKRFNVHSIVDERSAAFIALGMAQQLDHTVALICTSGTAALNFAPALAEAFYQRVPLLVVTADRPIEWIDQGEGQSIRQREVYRNYVKSS
jgi:2-succinyl-5-enolpyruvyl-6-hydroxy-3-cyclohexene-1-carboxylate synthase